MLNEKVIFADLPLTVKGAIVRSFDGEEYCTIVINSRLNAEQQRAAYYHELLHYDGGDFDAVEKSVDHVEYVRHYAM